MRLGMRPSLTKGLISVALIYLALFVLIYGCTAIINAQTEPTPTEDTGIGRATPTQPVTPTVTPTPLPTATAVAPEDRYEPDSFTMPPAYAGPAERSFNPVGDTDYFLFRLTAGMPTYFETFSLQGGADTEIILYDAETGGALGQDNNGGGGLASRVVLQLPTSKLIKVEIRNYALAFGPSVRYQFRIITEAELPPTSTPTPSRTPTITPSPTATMTPSATPTLTPTPRPVVTATAAPTQLPAGSWFTRTPIPVLPTPIVTIVVTLPIPTVVLPTIWPTHAPTATPTTAPTPLPTGPWFTRTPIRPTATQSIPPAPRPAVIPIATALPTATTILTDTVALRVVAFLDSNGDGIMVDGEGLSQMVVVVHEAATRTLGASKTLELGQASFTAGELAMGTRWIVTVPYLHLSQEVELSADEPTPTITFVLTPPALPVQLP